MEVVTRQLDSSTRRKIARKEYYQRNRLAGIVQATKWRDNNKEHVNKVRAVYLRNNAVKYKESIKAWRARNSDRVKQTRAVWVNLNRSRINLTKKLWCKANPEKVRASLHKRRAANDSTLCSQNIRDKIYQQSSRCYWCCKQLQETYHVDHVMPLARGGMNNPNNICISCPTCNLRKGTKMPMDFILVLLNN